MSIEKIIYKLECGDNVLAPSFLVNGCLWCPAHRESRKIADIIVCEWRIRCRKCKYARWCGLSEELAITLGTVHVMRHSGHEAYHEYTIRPASEKTLVKYRRFHGKQARTNV